MRRAITPLERHSLTLQFLATGRSYEDLKFSAVISPQALGVIIPETCAAIHEAQKKGCLKVRNNLNFLTMAYKYLKHHATTSDAKHINRDTIFVYFVSVSYNGR